MEKNINFVLMYQFFVFEKLKLNSFALTNFLNLNDDTKAEILIREFNVFLMIKNLMIICINGYYQVSLLRKN